MVSTTPRWSCRVGRLVACARGAPSPVPGCPNEVTISASTPRLLAPRKHGTGRRQGPLGRAVPGVPAQVVPETAGGAAIGDASGGAGGGGGAAEGLASDGRAAGPSRSGGVPLRPARRRGARR